MKNQIEAVPICLRIPADRLEQLKQLARERAVEEHRDIPVANLIREAIEKTFPRAESKEA